MKIAQYESNLTKGRYFLDQSFPWEAVFGLSSSLASPTILVLSYHLLKWVCPVPIKVPSTVEVEFAVSVSEDFSPVHVSLDYDARLQREMCGKNGNHFNSISSHGLRTRVTGGFSMNEFLFLIFCCFSKR